MYLPLSLRNPLSVESIGFEGATELGFIASSIRQLDAKRVQYIVWSPRLESAPYSLATFHEYLMDRYQPVWKFADQDEVWQRRPEKVERASTAGNNRRPSTPGFMKYDDN